MTQQEIYDIINRDSQGDWVSRIYDWFMLVMIMASITPLMFINDYPIFRIIEICYCLSF